MFEQTNEELTTRALRTYFIAARKTGLSDDLTEWPSTTDSGVQEVAGLRYVVLRNHRGPLAVFRVRNDGMLKRLKRYPADL